jgi:hypothetical protein
LIPLGCDCKQRKAYRIAGCAANVDHADVSPLSPCAAKRHVVWKDVDETPYDHQADILMVNRLPHGTVATAHLLYFVTKDHAFSDGNKRIGPLLLMEYLRRKAQSEPVYKDLMIRLILNLLEGDGAIVQMRSRCDLFRLRI